MEPSINRKVAAYNCPNCGAAAAPDAPSCCYCGSPLAVRMCSFCFGAASIGMRHCPYCGSEIADSAQQKAGTLRCPRCECNLSPQVIGKHPLQICMQCGGLWVDKDSFQDICIHEEAQEAVLNFKPELPESLSTRVRRPRRAYIPCPNCGKLMNHKNFSGSGVVLDWCRNHGSWFDRQELQRIVMFIREGGLRKARERELSQLKELKSRLRMHETQLAAQIDPNFEVIKVENNSDPLLKFLFQMFR